MIYDIFLLDINKNCTYIS